MSEPRADGAKIEIHLHHEGAAPPEFIRRLAAEKKVDLSKIFDETGGYVFTSFTEFLRTYEAACTVLQTPEDFYHLTCAILEESASHGVIYTEIFVEILMSPHGAIIYPRSKRRPIMPIKNTVSSCGVLPPVCATWDLSRPKKQAYAPPKLRVIF
jgi:hypothetical protein